MKTWQFWVIILVVVFVVIPLIYFAIVAKTVTKISNSQDLIRFDKNSNNYVSSDR